VAAKYQPIEIYQGDDWAAIVYVHDANGKLPDLSGYTALAQIRRSSADTDSTVDATITTSIDTINSLIDLSMSHTITTSLSGSFRWDLQLTNATGGISTIMYGPVAVIAEITR
jgi:hypothetical protein